MSNAVDRSWIGPALVGVGVITLARVILLVFNRTDLFVDEAQYWLWGQELALGYYSKPPMIGWVIRAFTEIGSDAQFWVRLPAPLFHGATAMILGAFAAQIFDRRAAILVALAYVTLPMVAVGSLLISTDTIMFPYLATSMLLYFRLLTSESGTRALVCGAFLGLAFLSKYAAVYLVFCAILAAPIARPTLRDVGLIVVAFLVVASPNLIWNVANGLTTVQHTLDNADWVRDPAARAVMNWVGLAEFFASQFAVVGPIIFAFLLVFAARWQSLTPKSRMLILFALPIAAIVCAQALLSRAYANWAAAAYLAAVVVVIPKLTKPWLIASFTINGVLCLLFPIATTMPTFLTRDGQPLLNRYIGRHQMSEAILAAADQMDVTTIVAIDRDILADLFYVSRNHPIAIKAMPALGRPPHHYAQNHPYEPADETVLFAASPPGPLLCNASIRVEVLSPETGAYRSHPKALHRTPGLCIRPLPLATK